MEPVSPELVLVDPDLAARVRTTEGRPPRHGLHRAVARGREVTPAESPRLQREPATARRRRPLGRLGLSLAAASLLAGGVLAAFTISAESGRAPEFVADELGLTPEAARVESRTASVKTTERQRRPPPARSSVKPRRQAKPPQRQRNARTAKRRKQAPAGAAAGRQTNAAVERRLLSLIVQSPTGKLPPALINRQTGLAKNNLQAVCTRSNDTRSFVCVVTSALQPAVGPVYALYRPTKRGGVFTWYRTRGD